MHMHVCMCVFVLINMSNCACGNQNYRSQFSPSIMGPANLTQVIRLGGKHHCPQAFWSDFMLVLIIYLLTWNTCAAKHM